MMSTPAQSPAQALMLLSTDCIITSARIPESVVRQLVSEGRVVVRANRPRLTADPLTEGMDNDDLNEFITNRAGLIAMLSREGDVSVPESTMDGTDKEVLESLVRDGIVRRDGDKLVLAETSPLTEDEIERVTARVQAHIAQRNKVAEPPTPAPEPAPEPVPKPVDDTPPTPKPAPKPAPAPAAEAVVPPALVKVLEQLATNSQHTVTGLQAIWRQLGGGTEQTVVVKSRRNDPTVEEVAQRIAVVLYLADDHMLLPSKVKNYKLSELQKLKADSAIKHGLESGAFKKVGPFLKLVAPEPLKLSWTELQQLKRRRERVS